MCRGNIHVQSQHMHDQQICTGPTQIYKVNTHEHAQHTCTGSIRIYRANIHVQSQHMQDQQICTWSMQITIANTHTLGHYRYQQANTDIQSQYRVSPCTGSTQIYTGPTHRHDQFTYTGAIQIYRANTHLDILGQHTYTRSTNTASTHIYRANTHSNMNYSTYHRHLSSNSLLKHPVIQYSF